MRISRAWLSDYVDFDDLSAEEFAELLNTRVAEVDAIHTLAKPMEEARVARVIKVVAHEKKDKISIVTVDCGEGERTVICGAPNCKEGMLSAFLAPGCTAVVGEDQKTAVVEKRKVYGILSEGMLVSEAELGLTGDHVGILEIDPRCEAKPGDLLSDVLGFSSDTVLEIDNKSVTHRQDLWSHFGFAREIAAMLGRPLKRNLDQFADDDEKGKALLAELGQGISEFKVIIAEDCPVRRFAGLELVGVAPLRSPLWIRKRLFSVGAGVRNILVDLSNYVMHDMGQPNHTYDADKLKGSTIWARMAKPQEYFLGLDGVERVMDEKDIVIADEANTIGIGGVLGGGPSSVSETSKRLFLEAANFDPVSIRLTTKRHQLRTDASNRFEKSRSPYAAPVALRRYTELLREVIPNFEIRGCVVDTVKELPKPIEITTTCSYIRERIGAEISKAEVLGSLDRLGFVITPASDGDTFSARVPYYRATRDISIADDLVEEVGRTFGYENVPETAPLISSTSPRRERIREFELRIADVLRGCGVSEAYAYSFENGERAERLGYSLDDRIELLNPVDTGRRHLRTSLVPGLIEFVERNVRFQTRVALFEIGRSYSTVFSEQHSQLEHRAKLENVPAFERHLLGIAYSSGEDENTQAARLKPALPAGSDFFAVKTLVERVCRLATPLKPTIERLSADRAEKGQDEYFCYRSWMHPGRSAQVLVNDQVIGLVAEVRPGVVDGLSSRSVVAELDLELLLEADTAERLFTPLSKFPDSFFEMSVVVPQRTEFKELKQVLESAPASSMLRDIEAVAVYQGAPLAEEEKSVSVRLVLGAGDHTLGPDEIEGAQAAFIAAIEQSSFALRS